MTSTPPGPSDDQTISQALEVLCAFKFCRKQAQSFKACMGKSSSEGGGSEAACKQQFQAYKTCSESNAEAVEPVFQNAFLIDFTL
eukprot:g1560.t1